MPSSIEAALAVVFGFVLVHAPVRLFYDFVKRFALIGHRVSDRNAVTGVFHRDIDFLLGIGDRRGVSGEKEYDELVSADPIGLRAAAQAIGNAFADGHERKVARIVADGIVQRFQTVYIQRQDRCNIFGIGAAVVVKRFSVQEVRQRIASAVVGIENHMKENAVDGDRFRQVCAAAEDVCQSSAKAENAAQGHDESFRAFFAKSLDLSRRTLSAIGITSNEVYHKTCFFKLYCRFQRQ